MSLEKDEVRWGRVIWVRPSPTEGRQCEAGGARDGTEREVGWLSERWQRR